MPSFFIYLLKANIALTVCFLAYRFGLRRLTFYTLNRFFLLLGILFSAIFPLVDIDAFFHRHEQLAAGLGHYSLDWEALQQYIRPQQSLTVWDVLQYIFWAGVMVMAIRFLIQLISLLRIHLQSRAEVVSGEKVRLMRREVNPFSFFKHIYINPSLHSPEDIRAILAHERVHVKGWHTADVLAGELNHIFYWFNPGAWLMKTAIRENLEFITDRKILQSGIDTRSYQYSLVNVGRIPYAAALANNFNFSHLKQRIMMMNKKRSSRINFLRYVVLIPIMVGIILLIFTNSHGQQKERSDHTVLKDSVVKPPPPQAFTSPKVVRDSVPPPPPTPRPHKVRPRVQFTPPKVVRDSVPPPPPTPRPHKVRPRVQFTPPKVVRDSVSEQYYSDSGKNGTIRIKGTDSHDHPLLIVNDQVVPYVKLKELKSDQITSVSVLKDETAIRKYGNKGKNGVVMITIKDTPKANPKPLILVNGKIYRESLDSIDASRIEKVNILKDTIATKRYGEKGKNGVVSITIKDSK